MALQYQVKSKEITAGAFSSIAPRSITNSQIVTVDVLVSDDVIANLTPDEVTEIDVMEYLGIVFTLWEVNRSVFWFRAPSDAPSGVVSPWLILSNKRCKRDPQNRLLFHVDIEYSTFNRTDLRETDLYPFDTPSDVASYPFLKETIWGEEERIIHEEAVSGGALPGGMRLPTGSLYSEPFRRLHPRRTIRQSQFEVITPAAIDQTIEERLFTTNDRTFEGDPAPSANGDPNPPRWMITDIEHQLVALPIGIVPTLTDAYLMTYLLERNSSDGGWMDRRALIDNYQLEIADNLSSRKPCYDPYAAGTIMDCLLAPDGTKRADQTGDPEYLNYAVQPQGIWSFLKI
jgi:hypothetical protein